MSKRIAVLMGGWSCEREISLCSGGAIVEALQERGYSISAIDVHRDLERLVRDLSSPRPDVVYNALHGVGGEDGVIQGVLEMLQLPYTHSGVTSSALAMDKVLSRHIFDQVGILTPPWTIVSLDELRKENPRAFPYVMKPIGEGSSKGVTLVFKDEDREQGLREWTFGDQILIEQYIPGREIQVAVLDNQPLGAIEIRPLNGFYDYTAKYTPGQAEHIMPANLDPSAYQEALSLSMKAHKALNCHGVTRSDFRYDDEGHFYLLEINTQPGMTSLSLVPEIAAYRGLSFIDILEKEIQNAKCHS